MPKSNVNETLSDRVSPAVSVSQRIPPAIPSHGEHRPSIHIADARAPGSHAFPPLALKPLGQNHHLSKQHGHRRVIVMPTAHWTSTSILPISVQQFGMHHPSPRHLVCLPPLSSHPSPIGDSPCFESSGSTPCPSSPPLSDRHAPRIFSCPLAPCTLDVVSLQCAETLTRLPRQLTPDCRRLNAVSQQRLRLPGACY